VLQRLPGGLYAGGDHAFDTSLAGPIPGQWHLGVDEEVGVKQGDVVLGGIEPPRLGVRRVDADAAQQRTDFPDVRSDDELGAQVPAEIGGQGARDSAVFENVSLAMHRAADHAHRATGADGRGQWAGGDGDSALVGKGRGDGREGDLEIGEVPRQVAGAETFQVASVQQLGPENASSHFGEVLPAHAGCDSSADNAAGTGTGEERRSNAGFGQDLVNADVGQASSGTATQSQSDLRGRMGMQTANQSSVYSPAIVRQRISRLTELVRGAGTAPHPSAPAAGRNAFTRAVDAVLLWVRRHARPVHWLAASVLGSALFGYAWVVGRTARVVSLGPRTWQDVPERCVLAIWHGCAPSLMAAIAIRRPRPPLTILISTEPRGDILHVFCRLLGLRVIRGDWEHHGWHSLVRVAEAVAGGACAVITPDGGAPRGVARPGVLVLAAAANVMVVAVGAECRPGIAEPHKWDKARNPLPFGRIAIFIAEPLSVGEFADAPALEAARKQLQAILDAAQQNARQALDPTPEEPKKC